MGKSSVWGCTIVVPMFVKKNGQKQKKSVKICKFKSQRKNEQIKTLLCKETILISKIKMFMSE